MPPHFFASTHSGVVRDLVLDLKYRDRRIIGKLLGEALGRGLPLHDIEAVVPVPLHKDSSRFFNQALEIARGLGLALGVEVIDALSWSIILQPQAKGCGVERRLMPLDAMSCRGEELHGRRVILVDDVRTTGTTLLRAQFAIEGGGGRVGAFVTWSSA